MNVDLTARVHHLRVLDLPPVWLVAALCVSWLLSFATASGDAGSVIGWLGTAFILYGVVLICCALFEMIKARTTFIPRKKPDALVTSGIFDWTRNPIYLGDALILTGAILRWEAYLALILVPAFIWFIQERFIVDEEAKLAAHFGDDWKDYAQKVRRWV